MNYITRLAEGQLNKLLSNPKVIIILGSRQVGKTTLVKHILANRRVLFLNLDIDSDKQRLLASAQLSPSSAIKSLGDPEIIVIDEAQRWPETARIVKGWHDSEIKCKVILLGSSSLNLLNQSAESLTGRNEKLFLSPLLFREILPTQEWFSKTFTLEQLQDSFRGQIHSLLMTNMIFGSYPEAVTTTDKQAFLLNLVSDYLLKDILQLSLIKSPEPIKRLLMLLAHQTGSEFSINELANSLDISRITVERYLELLEQTFVIFRLPAFSTNPRKEIAKSQKIYFWDTGIRNAILNEFSTQELRTDIGNLWENWVVAEFAKLNLLSGQKQNLYFWRSRAGAEIDLIIKSSGQLQAFEIKWKRQKAPTKVFSATYNIPIEIITSACPLNIYKSEKS